MSETPKPRGFAAMPPERRKALAALGGKRTVASGKGHRWSVDEARQAGRKGGVARVAGRKKKSDVPEER